MNYKGVIFDFNGTLFWDSQLHYDAWYEMSKRLRGTPFNDYEMIHHMFGRTNKNIMEYALGRTLSDEETERLSTEKELLYLDMCKKNPDKVHFAKGVEKYLDFLCKNNIPHTIATMSEKMNVDYYIDVFNLEKWFDIDKIVYSNGKIPGKPAPDIYLIASDNIGISPKDCIVFEDALSGINAAHSAGIGTIIGVASKESVEFYRNIDCVSDVITDFEDLSFI